MERRFRNRASVLECGCPLPLWIVVDVLIATTPCATVAVSRCGFLSFARAVIVAGMLTCQAAAQTLTVLHTFSSTSGPDATNSDGVNPSGDLILSGSAIYGTASY